MPYWKQEQLQQLTQEENQQQMFATALSLAEQLDMEFLAYRLTGRTVAEGPQVMMFNNYPAEWNELYKKNEYARIDPVLVHCHHSNMPVLWSPQLYKQAPSCDRRRANMACAMAGARAPRTCAATKACCAYHAGRAK